MTTKSDLRERAERIASLEEQREQIAEDIRDLYAVAKSSGYTVSALRKAIKVHRMGADKRAKHEAAQLDFETYLNAMEGLNKPRLREIQKAGEAKVAAFGAALDAHVARTRTEAAE